MNLYRRPRPRRNGRQKLAQRGGGHKNLPSAIQFRARARVEAAASQGEVGRCARRTEEGAGAPAAAASAVPVPLLRPVAVSGALGQAGQVRPRPVTIGGSIVLLLANPAGFVLGRSTFAPPNSDGRKWTPRISQSAGMPDAARSAGGRAGKGELVLSSVENSRPSFSLVL